MPIVDWIKLKFNILVGNALVYYIAYYNLLNPLFYQHDDSEVGVNRYRVGAGRNSISVKHSFYVLGVFV